MAISNKSMNYSGKGLNLSMDEINNIFKKFSELASPINIKLLYQQFDDFDQHVHDYFYDKYHSVVVPQYTYKEKDRYSVKIIDDNNLMHDVALTREEYILSGFFNLRTQLFSRITVLFETFLNTTFSEEFKRITIETKRLLPTSEAFIIAFFDDLKKSIEKNYKEWQNTSRKTLPFHVPNPKLKWHGDVKQLTTLFKQLVYDQKNDGGNYIECTKDDLVNFIHENFCQEDDNEFKLETIQNYFNDNNDIRSNKGPFINGYGNDESRPAKRKRIT